MKAAGTIAVVPMKPLDDAKTRLANELSPEQRIALSGNLLRRVIRAIVGLGLEMPWETWVEAVWVVGGDETVQRIAAEEGAEWYEDDGKDINDTLWNGFMRAFLDSKAALYLPGDLPFLKSRDVYDVVSASGHLRNISIAPARKGGGTNGILVPPDLPQPFPPLLGPDSFRRHLSQAALFGFSLAICYSQGMAFDLDTIEDLKACEYIEPGFLERLTTGDGRDER